MLQIKQNRGAGELGKVLDVHSRQMGLLQQHDKQTPLLYPYKSSASPRHSAQCTVTTEEDEDCCILINNN
jgi:hypothetical protein